MRNVFGWVLVSLIAAAPFAPAKAATAPAYSAILDHYEEIRQALVGDTLDGVFPHAREIERLARAGELELRDSAASAELLSQVGAAATELASARDLGAVRDAFGELSKPLIRLRDLAGSGGTVVVFCPMEKKSWLQPGDEIGNPYFGSAMAGCGTVLGQE